MHFDKKLLVAILAVFLLTTLVGKVSAETLPIPLQVNEEELIDLNYNEILEYFGEPDKTGQTFTRLSWEYERWPSDFYNLKILVSTPKKEENNLYYLTATWNLTLFMKYIGGDKGFSYLGVERTYQKGIDTMNTVREIVPEKLLKKGPDYIYRGRPWSVVPGTIRQQTVLVWELRKNQYVAVKIFRSQDLWEEVKHFNPETGLNEREYKLTATTDELYEAYVRHYFQGYTEGRPFVTKNLKGKYPTLQR